MSGRSALAAAPGPAASACAGLAEEVAASRRTIETSFLDMGQRLLDCARLLREIVSAHEAMPAELQGEDFGSAVELLERLRGEAERIAARHDEDGARVGSMMALARELQDPIDTLNRTVRNLGLIAMNARIIAGGMSAQGADFAAFATEMVELGRDAARIVAEFSRSHRTLVGALEIAANANDQFRRKHGQTLAAISARLGGQLATVEAHRVRAMADLAESGRMSAAISARIGDAVSALQIGDITRQRLEHVEEALHGLDEGAHSGMTQALVLRLQQAQLDETGADFGREMGSFAGALASLASDARRVLDEGRSQSEALLANGGTALAGLVADLGSMVALLADFEEMRARLAGLRAEVGECVSGMQARMETIATLERTMRLLSINTAVRCSRFGEEGRALRVVAQEMRELSALTVEAAGTVTGGLERSQAALDEDGLAAGASGHALSDDAGAAIALLEAVVGRLRARAATIAATGPRTARLLHEAATVSGGSGRHADHWRRAAAELGRAGERIDPQGEADHAFLASLRAGYTMAKERRIFDEIVGEEAAQPAEPAEDGRAGDAEADIDAMLF